MGDNSALCFPQTFPEAWRASPQASPSRVSCCHRFHACAVARGDSFDPVPGVLNIQQFGVWIVLPRPRCTFCDAWATSRSRSYLASWSSRFDLMHRITYGTRWACCSTNGLVPQPPQLVVSGTAR